MRRFGLGAAIVVLVAVAAFAQQQQAVGTSGMAGAPVVVTPDAVNFGPAPDVFVSGAQLAVLSGDPNSSGPYVVRLKMPDGYKIAPHYHPTDENITVIDGTFLVGMGDQFEENSLKVLPKDSYGKMPKDMHHYAQARGETTVQVEGMGPFKLTYVNASDDPRNKK